MSGVLKRYPAMKDSGVPWLGHVPEHWELRRLHSLLSRNDSGVWGEDFDDDGVIVLRSTEQTVNGEWKISAPARRRLTPSEYASSRLQEGDLVVTKSSGSILHIGKTSIVTRDVEALGCCFSNFMQRLRVKQEMIPRFLWYTLNGELGREQFNFFSDTTTGLANLNAKIINNVGVTCPPISPWQNLDFSGLCSFRTLALRWPNDGFQERKTANRAGTTPRNAPKGDSWLSSAPLGSK